MRISLVVILCLTFLLPTTVPGQAVTGPMVRFRTTQGDIDVTLLPDSAPKTVANFLNYVNRGAFNNSVFHRSVAGFIVQGGGYTWQNLTPVEIPSDPPIANEYSVSNIRGTLAMAKLPSGPDTATNQWFFNLADNSGNLNNQNGGFTVFGRVANSASLTSMSRIGALNVHNLGPGFDQFPLVNYRGGPLTDANVVRVTSIVQLDSPPVISANGVVSAGAFGGFPSAAPGSFIEIYGMNLAGTTRPWAQADFTGRNAPTLVDEVRVTVNGQSAYVSFVSPTQVNAQIPASVPAGGNVPVIVSYKGQSSAAVNLAVKSVAPGLLAPANFNVDDKQYIAGFHGNGGTYVTNGKIPGINGAPAAPGETLIFYGVGFGPVNESGTPVAGQVAQGTSSLVTPVSFKIGGTAAQILYAGFVPEFVGLYQFNVTVPLNVPSGDAAVEVSSGADVLIQKLFLPVQAP